MAPGSSTAFDVLGGARYWNQELDLSLALDASVDLGNLGLKRSGSRAVARSGSLNGLIRLSDCVCDTSWHREASFNSSAMLAVLASAAISLGSSSAVMLSTFGGSNLHGLVGYRVLAVDYTQDGPNKNNLDLVLHGPVVGLSFRW